MSQTAVAVAGHVVMTEAETQTATLAELEAVIDEGLSAFMRVGTALAQIRDRKLYRDTHETFEAYCQERFNFNRQRASQLIKAATVSRILDNPPARASHAEALAPLADEPELVRQVDAEVRATTNGKPRAADYTDAVERVRPSVSSRAEASDPPLTGRGGDVGDGSAAPAASEAEVERRRRQDSTAGGGHGSVSEGVGKSAGGKDGSHSVRGFTPQPLDAGDLARALLDLKIADVAEAIAENATADQKQALRQALGGTSQPSPTPAPDVDLREALADDGCTVLELSKAIGEAFTVDARLSLLALLADAADVPAERLAPLAHRLNVRVRPEQAESAAGGPHTLTEVKRAIREHLTAAEIRSLENELPMLRKEIGARERAAEKALAVSGAAS